MADLKTEDVAAICNVSVRVARAIIKKIGYRTRGNRGQWRVTVAALDAYRAGSGVRAVAAPPRPAKSVLALLRKSPQILSETDPDGRPRRHL